ncbi:LysR family transcriptional regulator [Endozoicomonadaceae bacterium StTr2]
MKTGTRNPYSAQVSPIDENISLSRLNLNLLPSLKALLDTRSVTEAARQLCVTQPTMSRNLASLRENLCDPLLIRAGNTTTLSELAQAIHPSINRLVVEAATIFENSTFDPSTTSRHFRIAGGYVTVQEILPQALCELRTLAPNFTFELELLDEHTLEKLHNGEIDLAVGYSGMPPAGLRSQEFVRYRLACLMSVDHPLANRALTMEDLRQYPHLVQTSGCSMAPQVQDFYARHSIEPKLSSPSFGATRSILAGSDYLTFCTPLKSMLDDRLVVRQIPDNPPEVEHRIVWPDYWNANRAHRWLRDMIFQCTNQILEDRYNVLAHSGGAITPNECNTVQPIHSKQEGGCPGVSMTG